MCVVAYRLWHCSDDLLELFKCKWSLLFYFCHQKIFILMENYKFISKLSEPKFVVNFPESHVLMKRKYFSCLYRCITGNGLMAIRQSANSAKWIVYLSYRFLYMFIQYVRSTCMWHKSLLILSIYIRVNVGRRIFLLCIGNNLWKEKSIL